MKISMILATLLFSISTFANDGGMAYIDVKGINPTNNAGDGTTVKFYGKDAANFMKLLPGYSNVVYDMVSTEVSELLQDNNRGVALVSNGWGLLIDCSAGDVVEPANGDYKTANYQPKQAECTISLEKNVSKDSLGDAFSMEPKNYRKNMCQ